MSSRIRIGTRGSKLALAQANWVALKLREATGAETELVVIRTTGDSHPRRSLRAAEPRHSRGPHGSPKGLSALGGKGVFVKEIQAALLEGEIDLATHSLKDLPVREPQGLCIAAIPLRADPADALVSLEGCGLDGLPPGAVIGTSSLRRRAQILNFRPDLVIEEMRGNVDTRLRKLEQDPDLSGLIVAAAAMERLGFERRITQRIPFHICLPAPGQGAISVEAREDDAQTLAIARAIDHPASHAEVRAERALVQAMGADCRDPLGALGRCTGERLALEGVLAAPDGQALVRARVEGDCAEPEQLGREAAERLRAGGAEEIMRQLGDRPSRGDL